MTHLRQALDRAAEWEHHHVPTVPAPHLSVAFKMRSWEDRIAGAITDFAGSMKFVYVHLIWFGLWVVINAGLLFAVGLGLTEWDPFPFGLLTLIVSLEAIFLSTFVMIAQNRLSAVADARAQADYQVNVRAEAEVAKLVHLVETLIQHHILTAADLEAISNTSEPERGGEPPAATE
jgi:uncharacterized membrane protein